MALTAFSCNLKMGLIGDSCLSPNNNVILQERTNLKKYSNLYITISEGIPWHNMKQKFSKSDNPVIRNGTLKFVKI